MDPKEIKAALKSAREAIRSKEYKEALKHCKSVLKADKTNYNALVFVGVSAEGLSQPDQAYTAYKKATEVEPGQLLAWQGLCGFLEKSEKTEHKQELVELYEKLGSLHQGDAQKKFDTQLKLVQLLMVRNCREKAVDVCKDILQWCSSSSETTPLLQVWANLADCLEGLQSPRPEDKSLLMEAYKTLLQGKTESEPDYAHIWLKYIKQLVKDSETDSLWSECSRFLKAYPETPDLCPAETLCHICLDRNSGGSADSAKMEAAVQEASQKLENADADNATLKFLKGCQELQARNFLAASALFSTGLKQAPASVSASLGLAQTQLFMHKKHEAKTTAEQGLNLLKMKDTAFLGDRAGVKNKLKLALASAGVEIGTRVQLEKTREICEQLSKVGGDSLEVMTCLARSYLASGYTMKCMELIQTTGSKNVDLLDLEGWCLFLQGNHTAADAKFQKVLAQEEEHSLALYHRARVLWLDQAGSREARELCFQMLLKAAKADPFYSPVFLYLGHYYAQVLQDSSKSRRCYQKAYELDADNEEAGSALVDCLMATADEGLGLEILESVTRRAAAGCGKWAWLRLGLLQMKLGEPSTAILSLQSALRADPLDVHCWECLGDAYMKRGSFTAALKAFTKATELDSSAMYCYYQLASIKQTLGMYAEAVQEYQGLLEKSVDYIPALKGLGETCVCLAKTALTQFFHGRAADHCQSAIWCLTRAAGLRPDLSCLWKLLGDACTILNPLPEQLVNLSIPNKLLAQGSGDSAQESSIVDKKGLMALGARCYGMALKQEPNCASLWHDLGVNYLYQSELADKVMAKVMAGKSVQALQKAVTLDTENYRHWSALGTVAASKFVEHPALAQHCFIKSVQAEPNNVVAWTNLGTLYLKSGQVELAHEAFKVAQSLEPSYVASWVGQALIAETVGHEDTMDLFRHATELANHVEAGIGYAHWVCATLQDTAKMGTGTFQYAIEQMSAVPAASDALAKYTDRVRTNPTAYSMHGLLLERQGLHRLAAEAFSKAVALLESSGATEDLDNARANYARTLGSTGQYEEAVVQHRKVATLQTVDTTCSLALLLYKAGNYQESLQAYEKALELSTKEEDKAHIQAAMGMVAYKSGDVELAKTALFKCSQTSDSLPGLQALMSVGVLQNNATLATAVLQELAKMAETDSAAMSDLAWLTTCLHVAQGDVQAGKRHLSRCLHSHPHRAALWSHMSQYLLRHLPQTCAGPAARCARVADSANLYLNDKLALYASLGNLGAGWHGNRDSNNNTLSAAQRAVHVNPDCMLNWCGLLGAQHSQHVLDSTQGKHSADTSPTLSLCAHLMARVEHELTHGSESEKPRLRALHLWCVKQYMMALLMAGRQEQALQFLKQAVWLYEEDVVLKSLLGTFDQNFAEIKANALNDKSQFSWQLLSSLYIFHGLVKELESSYRQWLQNAENASGKLQPLVRLAYLSFQQLVTNEGNEKWVALLKEASTEALRLDPDCTVINLIVGLQHLKDKKINLAKESLYSILSVGNTGQTSYALDMAKQLLLQICIDKKDEEGFKTLEASALLIGNDDFLKLCRSARKQIEPDHFGGE